MTKLLNKYYRKLLGKLSNDDSETLRDAQRNWLSFRDAEARLNQTLSKEEYSGGGSMQSIFNASDYLDLTESRVNQLFYHLLRISNG